jgi:hypothetical protein
MAYIINNTRGDIIAEVLDNEIDTDTLPLAMIGKSATNFGESINENFVKLLENFANPLAPTNAILGQLWYDSSEGRVKVFDGDNFRNTGGPIVSSVKPTNLTSGDLWINSQDNQMYFFDGTDLVLAGPIYKQSQGINGFVVDTITDTAGTPQTIAKVFVGDKLVGFFSKTTFNPGNAIAGHTGTVSIGFNFAIDSLDSPTTFTLKNTTVDKSLGLVDQNGNFRTAENFITNDANVDINGYVEINNDEGIYIGDTGELQISVNNSIAGSPVTFESTIIDKKVLLRATDTQDTYTALEVDSANKKIVLFPNEGDERGEDALKVHGNVEITGSLLIKGDTTTVTTSVLEVADKDIVLGNTSDSTPSDTHVDGGGIIVRGDTDHTFTWSRDNLWFTSSEGINIDGGAQGLYINGQLAISGNSLGANITSAPGITSFGPQNQIQADNVLIDNNTISTVNLNGDLVLSPNGTGSVDVASSKITNVTDPVNAQDVATKNYVDTNIIANRILLQLEITGLDNAKIAGIIDDIFPASADYEGLEAHVHTQFSAPDVSDFTILAGSINKSIVTVNKGANTENQSVLEDIGFGTIPGPNAVFRVQRGKVVARIVSGQWQVITNVLYNATQQNDANDAPWGY